MSVNIRLLLREVMQFSAISSAFFIALNYFLWDSFSSVLFWPHWYHISWQPIFPSHLWEYLIFPFHQHFSCSLGEKICLASQAVLQLMICAQGVNFQMEHFHLSFITVLTSIKLICMEPLSGCNKACIHNHRSVSFQQYPSGRGVCIYQQVHFLAGSTLFSLHRIVLFLSSNCFLYPHLQWSIGQLFIPVIWNHVHPPFDKSGSQSKPATVGEISNKFYTNRKHMSCN